MLRKLGLALMVVGALLMLSVPVQTSMQEVSLESSVMKNLESYESLRNVPQASDAVANDNFEYSLNGTISIESESFNAVLMDSVSDEDLLLGAGHYPTTAMPGQVGNFAVAVHRPLVGNIDTMGEGDTIEVVNNGVTYTYEWRESFVVKPDAVEVLEPLDGKWLTLTTCHPRYSNYERLIVRAELTQVGG